MNLPPTDPASAATTKGAPRMTSSSTVPEKPSEGWQAEKESHLRVYHYIRDMFALCQGLGFYRGELVEGGLTSSTSTSDCAKCRRLVDKELAALEKRRAVARSKGANALPADPAPRPGADA